MRHGPEFRQGWRERLTVDDVPVEIHARHHTRNRVPRPHEYARQVGLGRPLAMVEETTHEWQVLVRGGRPATVRIEPSGTFHCSGDRLHHRSLGDAARSHAKREIAILAQAAARRSAATETMEDDEPTPSGP